jgi:hypothetical protein
MKIECINYFSKTFSDTSGTIINKKDLHLLCRYSTYEINIKQSRMYCECFDKKQRFAIELLLFICDVKCYLKTIAPKGMSTPICFGPIY